MPPSNANVCLSGGAIGADIEWGKAALAHDHTVLHFIFEGHEHNAPASLLHTLSPEELIIADAHLAKANETLGRRWPNPKRFLSNLLRRNYYQIIWTNSVYAISTFKKGMVGGGTAWAVQMYLDRFDTKIELPCFVFDQERKTWTQWDGGGFMEIDRPPPPSGTWTGIGTRDLNSAGSAAIQEVWEI